MKSLALLSRLHRDGGLWVVTRDAAARPVARSVLFPDGDVTTIFRADITEGQQRAHVRAMERQVHDLTRARRHLAGMLSALGAGAAVLITGVSVGEAWVSGAGGTGLIALLVAAWRFRGRIRGARSERKAV